MKILFIGTKQSPNNINNLLIQEFKNLGHNVVRFDYIEEAVRIGKKARDKAIRRVYYEQKPDIIFLSKGNTICPECIQKISKKTPLIFMIFKSLRSFRMHPEIEHFFALADTSLVTDENVYKHYREQMIDNLFYFTMNKGGWTVRTEAILEGTKYEKYRPVEIKTEDKIDVVYVRRDIIEGGGEHQKTHSRLAEFDLVDLDGFREICSSAKLFVTEKGFKEDYPILYRKMTLSGALILEGDEAKEIPNLLRFYMKRKSLFSKRLESVEKEILEGNTTETQDLSMSLKDVASLFINAVVKETKSRK